MTPGVRLGQVSFVWRPWMVCVTLLLAAATFLVFCLSIGIGDFPIGLSRVIATILGRGEQVDEFVIMDLRMPRALAGLLVGIALGVSGAITQSVARNPLASPDILGYHRGSQCRRGVPGDRVGRDRRRGRQHRGPVGGGARGRPLHRAAGVLPGVAARDRRFPAHPHRHLGDRRDGGDHHLAPDHRPTSGTWHGRRRGWSARWTTGRGTRSGWCSGARSSSWWSSRPSRSSSSPCTSATRSPRGWASASPRVRAVLLLCAVLLAAAAVSAAGPVPFVALVAPQVAMRLARYPTPPLVASGLVGALLLIGADLHRRAPRCRSPFRSAWSRPRSAAPSLCICWCGRTSDSDEHDDDTTVRAGQRGNLWALST